MTFDYQRESVDRGIQEDGRRLWVFSQSKLKAFDICGERGRRGALGLMPDGATDSTAIGTAVHAAIEACVDDMIAGQGPWALADMTDLAVSEFLLIMDEPTSQWVKNKSVTPCAAAISQCVTSWYVNVLPTLAPLATEVGFGPLTIHEDDKRVVQLQGTIDYIDAVEGLVDWKTAGRSWQAWEHERWDVQATVYTWSQVQQFNSMELRIPQATLPFVWHVMQTNGEYQKIVTHRHAGDWAWLKERCLTLALTLEAELPSWPKNDTSALCSPAYCPAWGDCKGQFYAVGWPKPSQPA